MRKHLQTQIISRHIQSLQASVDFWENYYDPEHSNHHGCSTKDRAERKREKLKSFKDDIKYLSFDKLPITEVEQANYLRAYAIECYDTAHDFSDNIYIVMRRLRECVEIRQELIKLYPQLEIYSNRGICTRTKIRLQ